MTKSSVDLFHMLPYPARVIAASLRGYQYRHYRYGGDSARRTMETLERDRWSPRHWREWREKRLIQLLDRAATQSPWYRDYWRRQKGGPSDWRHLENWPILEKDEFRRNSALFLTDDCDRSKLIHLVTSGTTGSPTHVWETLDAKRTWYAQFEARCRHWNGITRHDRWAHLGGKPVTPLNARKPPYWVWNQGLNQLYLSSYHLFPSEIRHYCDAMTQYKVKYLLGYPSAIYELARQILNERMAGPQLKVVLTDAEPLYAHQRRTISEAFGCPVRQTYGMVEIAAAGSECEEGTMHRWPDTGVLEVFDGNRPVAPGEVGDFVCTGLINMDMPLIRFRVGDRGSVLEDGECACGRTLPILRSIEGRISDMLVTRDGRRLSPANVECIFDDSYPIVEGQLLQHSLTDLTLRYVPAPGFRPETSDALERSVRRLLGDVKVRMQPMDRIPRGPNGKMRAVICLMSDPERVAARV